MKKRVLITGANSLLGVNTVNAFLAAGYAVRGLLRNKASYTGDAHPDLELYEGNFTDPEFTEKAIKDCGYVVHCAAKTGQYGPYDSFHKVNVSATEQLIKAAIANGVKRIVYVGSANIFAFGDGNTPGNEERPICHPFSGSAYAISKFKARQCLCAYTSQIEIVTVCPTFMLGAYDSRPSSGRIVLMGYGRRIRFYPPGGKNFVHVQDVAEGIVAAMDKGHNGECYLLSNENISYKDFFRSLAEKSGKNTVLIPVPKWILLAAGTLGDIAGHLGLKTEATRNNMEILCVHNYYSNAKSVRELGMTYRPVSQAMDDSIAWFRMRGLIR